MPTLKWIPSIGISVFFVLYIYATTLYPGGSQIDKFSVGFDWINNYWCNLMRSIAINGQPNPARPFSIIAHVILCLSLMIFFIQFAETCVNSKVWKQLIAISGVTSMFFASLIFTQYHDSMTIISSVFGLVTVLGIVRELYYSKLVAFKITGLFCVLLLGLNNYIYYSNCCIHLLPVLQKITFAFVLLWIVGLNIKMVNLTSE